LRGEIEKAKKGGDEEGNKEGVRRKGGGKG